MQPTQTGNWAIARTHPRYVIDVRIVVDCGGKSYGRTQNVSEGGVGATVPANLKQGDIVQLTFQMPNADPLSISAEVRYARGFQYGFQFVNATAEQRSVIERSTRNLKLAL